MKAEKGRELAKYLIPAITYFAKGGNLWYYNGIDQTWKRQSDVYYGRDSLANIIEDKHFKIRKAYALGEKIEYLNKPIIGSSGAPTWIGALSPDWDNDTEYRIKPEEPVYEYQFYRKRNDRFILTEDFYIDINLSGYTRFEPSKRLKD